MWMEGVWGRWVWQWDPGWGRHFSWWGWLRGGVRGGVMGGGWWAGVMEGAMGASRGKERTWL